MMLLGLFVVGFLPRINGLLGYDCGGTSFNVTSISLLDVGECNEINDQPNATSTYIQLLQVAEYDRTKVFSCRVEIDRHIYYCGMHSHISLVYGSRRKYLVDMDVNACTRLHNTRTYSYGHGAVATELVPNMTNYRTLTLAGSAGVDGTCHGAQFSDSYGTWHKVVVQASIYISFWEYYATAKTGQDVIVLRSGARCRTSDLTCKDDDGADVFWAPLPDDKCQFHAYDVLYQGLADKIFDKASQYPVVYSLTSDKITFALSRKSERQICGYTLIQTEHPKLLIVETSRDNPFSKQERVMVENLDTFVYFNSKLVYIEKHIKNQLQTLYNNVINQKCRLERQVLQNAIAIALEQPDMFAYHIMKGPGYIAVISGEVAHIIKCIPVDVMRRSTEECYAELPVTFANVSMFLAPKTRVLQKTGTPLDCNPLLPTMYRIKGGWITLTPKLAAAPPPETLQPLIQPTWKYIDSEHLAESGIYSADDLNRLRDHIMFPVERPSLMNNFAQVATGHRSSISGISLTNLLDDKTLDYITESASERFFAGITKFGTYTASVIGIWMIFKIIKMLADTLIHGYALHSIYGWSVHLLGAIFSSITNLLLHLGRKPPSSSSNNPSPAAYQSPPSEIMIEANEQMQPLQSTPTAWPSSSIGVMYPNIQPELTRLNKSITTLEKRVSGQHLPTKPNDEGKV